MKNLPANKASPPSPLRCSDRLFKASRSESQFKSLPVNSEPYGSVFRAEVSEDQR